MQTRTSPRHAVTISYKFALGRFDVTRTEFETFVRESGYQVTAVCYGWAAAVGLPVTWRDPGFPQSDRDPVVCVSWLDAQAYLGWLSRKTHQRYRLPSEAEWEYAARAGTTTARYWGDDVSGACRHANVADLSYMQVMNLKPNGRTDFDCSDGHVYTSPVGSFLPNAFGLYDMLGNVHQLVEDCWNETYVGAPTDGSAWQYDVRFGRYCIHARVRRGSSFEFIPAGVRAAHRSEMFQVTPDDTTGFRVARDL